MAQPTYERSGSTENDLKHDVCVSNPQDTSCTSNTRDDPSIESLPGTDNSLIAWLQVLGGFLAMFNTWGIALSFGVFQAYYESESDRINATPSSIAWIGSLQAALLLLVGGLCGRIFDAGHLRFLLLAGSFLIVFGLMMTSLAHAYWQILLAQSICVGIGMGCLLVPSVATVGTWFVKRRGTAFGIVSSGGALGGIVLPFMLQALLKKVGFGWTLRILGFVSLVTLATCTAVLRQRLPPRVEGSYFEWAAFKELDFALFTLGYFLVSMGLYVLPQFVQVWTTTENLATSSAVSYYLPIINAASIPGRIIMNFVSDHLGPLNVQIPCIIASAIMVLAWIGVESPASMVVIVTLFGFFSGALLALPLSVLAKLTKDQSRLGARMGVFFVCEAVGTAAGAPIGGAIIGENGSNGRWDVARIWAGTMIIAGGLLILGSRCVVSRHKQSFWVRT